MYNILRIYTPKTKVVKFDESTKFEEINNPKNLSKCSIRALTPIKEESLSNGHIDQLQVECKVIDGQEEVLEKPNIMKHLKILCDKIKLKELFAPALWGSIFGVIIGIVPQFRKLLVGQSAHLHVVQTSIAMWGN